MTNQLETAKEWIADLNKIIDKTDNECTKQKRDVLEWLVEEAELRQEQVERNLKALDYIDEIERRYNDLESKNKRLQEFYDYFANLHGNGLEVANYHLNGATEPFDNFFDEAEKVLKGETK